MRNTFRYTAKQDWGKISKALKNVYQAPGVEVAEAEFAEFREPWEARYPAVVKLWQASWETFTPSLALPAEMRRLGRLTTAWTGRCAAGWATQLAQQAPALKGGIGLFADRADPHVGAVASVLLPTGRPSPRTSPPGVTDQSVSDSHCQERCLVIAGSTDGHDQPHA